jgi:hypothetical protein
MSGTKIEKKSTGWIGRHWIGATAALITGGLFLIAAVDLILTGLTSVKTGGWLPALQNNWLVVIFKLLSGFGDGQNDQLKGINALDVTILLLVGITLLGLFAVLRKTSKTWSLIALALPFLGLVVFLVTQMAGRSAVMVAILIISVVMLRSAVFNNVTAWLGIVAGALLLVGDFSVGSSYAATIVPLFGIGYLLLIVWLFLAGINLLLLDNAIGRIPDRK